MFDGIKGKREKRLTLFKFSTHDISPDASAWPSLLPLPHLCDADEDVGGLILQQVVERVLPGLPEQLVFDGDECGLAQALQGQDHAIGQQAVHQDPAETQLSALTPYRACTYCVCVCICVVL